MVHSQQDTFEYFLEEYKGDEKNGLQNLKSENYEGEAEIQKACQDFKKHSFSQKVWKSIKL